MCINVKDKPTKLPKDKIDSLSLFPEEGKLDFRLNK
jgi:hypothetical protein